MANTDHLVDRLAEAFDTPVFKAISEVADGLGYECYAVGGYVRDIFLRRPSGDIDVVVVGSGVTMAETLARRLGKSAHLSVFKSFGTAQIKWHGLELEFVGLLDLQNRLLRTPAPPDITFSDDPLRMMRCVRFATQLKFNIEDEAFEAIRKNAKRIEIVSKERIIDEFNKIMSSSVPSIGLVLLDETGLLDEIFPELKRLQGVETRNGRGHKDNFYHTLQVVDNIARESDNLWLRWAALLHDIAKPQCKRWDNVAGWTFHNHNYIGAKMVPAIFKRLKLPLNEKMKYVQKLVGLHMRPIVLSEDIVTDSAVRRLLFEAGDDIDDLMTLCEADITSRNAERKRRFFANFELVRQKLKEIEQKDHIRNFKLPVDGNDIMRLFGLPQGREVGELRNAVKDAILDGRVPNERQAALGFVISLGEEKGLKRIADVE